MISKPLQQRDEKELFLSFCYKNNFEKQLFISEKPTMDSLKQCECYGFYHDNKMVGIGFVWHKDEYKILSFVNIAFIKAMRGKRVLRICRQWLKDNRMRFNRIMSYVRKKDKNVLLFNQWLGFRPLFESKDLIMMELGDGKNGYYTR